MTLISAKLACTAPGPILRNLRRLRFRQGELLPAVATAFAARLPHGTSLTIDALVHVSHGLEPRKSATAHDLYAPKGFASWMKLTDLALAILVAVCPL